MTDGLFADAQGVCVLDDNKRVRLLMDLLGGPRQVTVPKRQVAEMLA